MKKRLLLSLLEGSFEKGFPAILQINSGQQRANIESQVSGRLPPAPELWLAWQNWQLAYRQMVHPQSRIKPKPEQITNISCLQLGSELGYLINNWLNQGNKQWQKIRDSLQRNLHQNDEIEFLIQTSDIQLQQIPWHLWDFFDHYPYAEIAISTSEYHRIKSSFSPKKQEKVRILAILGDREGIDLNQDKIYLEQLSSQAEIKFLVEPQIEELNDQLWEKGWDILFFAGHSSSSKKGQIWLNKTDILTLEQLKYALKKAINNGLQLAIFNSCDGLGLARDLADLQLGQIIVMREPVPDVVAQTFLRYFLTAFATGKSLYNSVRSARERLQKLETNYPYATWLPVIFQNPAATTPTWQDFYTASFASFNPRKIPKAVFLLSSVLATALIVGIRQLGILQPIELKAFDSMMRLRPNEGLDSRLLLVTITEKDIQNQNPQERRSSSLSDKALTKLLQKIVPLQPQVIGLDIYRDFSTVKNQSELKNYLQHQDNFVAVCEVGNSNDYRGISPPPEVPKSRLSFSNMPVDSDGVIRRQLLGMAMAKDYPCQTGISFSLRVAQLYLAAKNISIHKTSTGELLIGDTAFKPLQTNTGGYSHLDSRGFQILLNYRSTSQIAQQVNLSEILNNSLDSQLPKLVKNRIVLIGTVAPSFKDYFPTPYSSNDFEKMPGLFIQSHMISQILSTVIDKRPLLWYLSEWVENIWILGWSLMGVIATVYCPTVKKMGIASLFIFLTLSGICYFFLLFGGWIPLIPPILAICLTVGIIKIYQNKSEFFK